MREINPLDTTDYEFTYFAASMIGEPGSTTDPMAGLTGESAHMLAYVKVPGGSAFAALSGTFSEVTAVGSGRGQGFYKFVPNAIADFAGDTEDPTESGMLLFVLNHGGDGVDYYQLAFIPYVVRTPKVDVEQWNGDTVAVPATAGVPSVDAIAISGSTTATDNLQATYDGTGYSDNKAPATQEQLAALSSSASTGLTTIETLIGTPAASVSADIAALPTAAGNADAVWDEARAGHATAGSYGATSEWASAGGASAADVADAVWDESRAGHVIAGSFGEGVVVSSLLTAAKDAIVDAIMAYSHDTGLTVKGAFRRMDAVLSGKATGLKGAVARFFMRDGTTVAVAATQDTAAGTRAAATVTGSEA